MLLTPLQCRMARAALDLGVRDLASMADVSPNTIARLEKGEALHRRTLAHVRGALEAAGANFIAHEAISVAGGEGVRIGGIEKRSRRADIFALLWSMPEKLRYEPLVSQNIAARKSLLDVFEQVLDMVEDDDREPDTWERLNLSLAAGALARSQLFLALAQLWRAITPPDNRAPDYPISGEDANSVRECDLAHFRNLLISLQETPVRKKSKASSHRR